LEYLLNIMKPTIKEIAPYVRYARKNISMHRPQSFVDPEYVFTYIKSGQGTYVIEGCEYSVKAGDMILMSPYMLHVTKSPQANPMEQCVLHFDLFYKADHEGLIALNPETNFDSFKNNINNPETLLVNTPAIQANVPETVQGKVYRLYSSIMSSFKEKRELSQLLRERAAMLEIISYYLDLSQTEIKGNKIRSRSWRNIEKALTYIHVNYSFPISLEDIGREASLAPTYLCALFRNHTGLPVHRYLNDLRISKAKRLLEETELSLSEIADMTGLGDIYAFSKIFKKYEKVSPSKYRQLI